MNKKKLPSHDAALRSVLSNPREFAKELRAMPPKEADKYVSVFKSLMHGKDEDHIHRALINLLEVQPQWVDTIVSDDVEKTGLMLALEGGKLGIAEILIRKGANPKRSNEAGENALDFALKYSANRWLQRAVVDFILENAKFSEKDLSRALYSSVENANFGASKSLVNHGAGFSAAYRVDMGKGLGSKGLYVGNALHLACEYVNVAGFFGGESNLDILLLSKDAKNMINCGWDERQGYSPLHALSLTGSPEDAIKLIKMGALVNPPADWLKHKNFETPLMTACLTPNVDMVEFLLKRKANIKLVDEKNRSALHYLADGEGEEGEERIACAKILLAKGADPLAKGKDGKTAADLARDMGRDDLASLLDNVVLENQTKSTDEQNSQVRRI